MKLNFTLLLIIVHLFYALIPAFNYRSNVVNRRHQSFDHCNEKTLPLNYVVHRSPMSMSLTPLSSSNVEKLIPRKVTNEQWISYWGVNEKERLQRILESFLIAYGGAWLAWFLSFLAGSFVAGIIGSCLIFNWMYTPWLNANRRNMIIRSSRYYYGFFDAKIDSLKRIKRRAGKTIGAVPQEFLTLLTMDESGRTLEIITEWQESYEALRVGMSFKTVIMSPRSDFSELGSVTDGYVPESNSWVGDYPYLSKDMFKSFVYTQKKKQARIKETQQQQQQQMEKDYDADESYESNDQLQYVSAKRKD